MYVLLLFLGVCVTFNSPDFLWYSLFPLRENAIFRLAGATTPGRQWRRRYFYNNIYMNILQLNNQANNSRKIRLLEDNTKCIHQLPARLLSRRLCLRVSYSHGGSLTPSQPPPGWPEGGELWREKVSNHALQFSHATPCPIYLGWWEGGRMQQVRQQQYFHPCPTTTPASSMPLPLPPYCIRCSAHVWREVLQLSWYTRQWAG